MVMKIACDVEQSLTIKISYDDGTIKTKVVSNGDYVSVTYNSNGARRIASGVVTGIHANPYSTQTTRKDWYFVINNDDVEAGPVGSRKIYVVNLIDVEIISMARQVNAINTPNNPMRVTDIRLKAGYLQISTNNGKTWKTVGLEPVSDMDPTIDGTLHQRIHDLIGSDQYTTSDELVVGFEEIIRDEIRKALRKLRPEEEDGDDCNCHCHGTNSIFDEC